LAELVTTAIRGKSAGADPPWPRLSGIFSIRTCGDHRCRTDGRLDYHHEEPKRFPVSSAGVLAQLQLGVV